ncbi:HD-GYP domain-containing protein [Anaerocolumna sp. MB42-C2]|uniref:HD-GYP domain-containing protein n=1 Tax=Anaerocolumna sp. MB42-C2 TaxID=3070997 RepID=UPI0027DFB00B|nr:HD domain-containing phosphohydrolase [Anaerocolumna sp. MB42-C2]WMJ89309.1 HD domain-containing protein [Anaerocolumna sp. MB42-C2]
MADIIASKNIYDKNGVLLLAKGQKATDIVLEKLRLHEIYEKEQAATNNKIKVPAVPVTPEFKERWNLRDDRILAYANEVLSTIIFESKTKPWWMLVNVLTNYVDWMYTHSLDVAMISLMIAAELKYKDNELWNLGLGALLHDVGKIMIPKSILQKPGPLNDTEMFYMKQHCELGLSSLTAYNLSADCTDIVIQHHERLDGSGYPYGLKENEICFNAKIVMVADTIDAITSGRPYKQPKSMDTAIKILSSETGKYPQEIIPVLELILMS